jgi:hypothetical protein
MANRGAASLQPDILNLKSAYGLKQFLADFPKRNRRWLIAS